ncbi:MAG: hypothetical protein ACK53W_12545 [Gemmatimonadota bacterium]
MAEQVFAWTPPGLAPPYVAVREEANGEMTIIVRGPAAAAGVPGPVGQTTMPYAQAVKLAEAILGLEQEG